MSLIQNHKFRHNWFYDMPHVTGSSSGSEIRTTESTVRALSGTSSGIPFGPL